MTQPEALRLADELEDEHDPWPRLPAAAELRRLHAENFALAAGQCMNVVGDEGGSPICAKAQQLQAARERDNVSFKELLAQRDALLEAYRKMKNVAAGYSNLCDDSASTSKLEREFEAADAIARAAIKAVEENT